MTDRPSCPKNLCLAEPLAGSARAPFATYEAALGDAAPLLAAAARRAVERPEASHRLCAELRRRMRRNRRADPRRPALLTSSRLLGDRLLRRRGEHEDPIGAAGAEV